MKTYRSFVLLSFLFLTSNELAADDSWITFLSRRSGENVLYRMRPDGTDLKAIFGAKIPNMPALPEGTSVYREPHFSRLSPDRKFFLSWATDVSKPKGGMTPVFLLRLGSVDGGPTRVIASPSEEIFTWSPDSQRIAYAVLAGNWRFASKRVGNVPPSTAIKVIRRDGTQLNRVLEKPGIWHVSDWSPDGKKLLLVFFPALVPEYGTSTLIEFDLERAEKEIDESMKRLGPSVDWPGDRSADLCLKKLTSGGWYQTPRYSPDGKWIAAVRNAKGKEPAGRGQLVVIDRKSGREKSLTNYEKGVRGPICWSPESDQILFSRFMEPKDKREPGGGLSIWTIERDGSNGKFLTTGWSPEWQ